MERRNRNILVILIAAVIVIAIFSSFGQGLFTGRTPSIVLPTTSPSQTEEPPEGPNGGDGSVRLEVTADTVQSVIATLSRPDSYYRVVTIDDFWGDGKSGRTIAKVWVDSGWVRVESTNAAGLVRTSLVGDGKVEVHYSSGGSTELGEADAYSADLEGQRIPTYEDVLDLDRACITNTGYEEKMGQACIFVETEDTDLDLRERYWISTDTGLLVAAETWEQEKLVYSMYSDFLERPCPVGILPPHD